MSGTDPDDRLVDELRVVVAAVDAVPDGVLAAARAAFGTRHLDRQLAELIADSGRPGGPDDLDDPDDPAGPTVAAAFEGVRTWTGDGPSNSRLLSFASGDVQLDLEVSGHGDQLDVIGQFTGADIAECVLEFGSGGEVVLEVDSLGRFLINAVPPGPVRARCRSVGGRPVVTAWVIM
jgi:hypothetical protein